MPGYTSANDFISALLSGLWFSILILQTRLFVACQTRRKRYREHIPVKWKYSICQTITLITGIAYLLIIRPASIVICSLGKFNSVIHNYIIGGTCIEISPAASSFCESLIWKISFFQIKQILLKIQRRSFGSKASIASNLAETKYEAIYKRKKILYDI